VSARGIRARAIEARGSFALFELKKITGIFWALVCCQSPDSCATFHCVVRTNEKSRADRRASQNCQIAVASLYVASRRRVPGYCHRCRHGTVVSFLYCPFVVVNHHPGRHPWVGLPRAPMLSLRLREQFSGAPSQLACRSALLATTHYWPWSITRGKTRSRGHLHWPGNLRIVNTQN